MDEPLLRKPHGASTTALEGRSPRKRKVSHNRTLNSRQTSLRGAEAGRGCALVRPAESSSPMRQWQKAFRFLQKRRSKGPQPVKDTHVHGARALLDPPPGCKGRWPPFLRALNARAPDGSPPAPRKSLERKESTHNHKRRSVNVHSRPAHRYTGPRAQRANPHGRWGDNRPQRHAAAWAGHKADREEYTLWSHSGNLDAGEALGAWEFRRRNVPWRSVVITPVCTFVKTKATHLSL